MTVNQAPSVPSHAEFYPRVRSFTDWPKGTGIRVADLVKSGFYYLGYKDRVQCFQCGGMLENWKVGDDVDSEHARNLPHCPFIVAKRGQSFVDVIVKMDILASKCASATNSPGRSMTSSSSCSSSERENSTKIQYRIQDGITRATSRIPSLHIVTKLSHINTSSEYVPRGATRHLRASQYRNDSTPDRARIQEATVSAGDRRAPSANWRRLSLIYGLFYGCQ